MLCWGCVVEYIKITYPSHIHIINLQSQEHRDRQNLQKAYFLFISSIASNNVTSVISSQGEHYSQQSTSHGSSLVPRLSMITLSGLGYACIWLIFYQPRISYPRFVVHFQFHWSWPVLLLVYSFHVYMTTSMTYYECHYYRIIA